MWKEKIEVSHPPKESAQPCIAECKPIENLMNFIQINNMLCSLHAINSWEFYYVLIWFVCAIICDFNISRFVT